MLLRSAPIAPFLRPGHYLSMRRRAGPSTVTLLVLPTRRDPARGVGRGVHLGDLAVPDRRGHHGERLAVLDHEEPGRAVDQDPAGEAAERREPLSLGDHFALAA